MKRLIALGALLLVLGTNARADNFNVSVVSGSIGENLDNGQYAGTFTVTDTTPSSPYYNAPFTAFCVDLTDHVSFGAGSITGTITAGAAPNQPLASPLSTIWGNTQYTTDVGKRLDYLVTQVMGPNLGVPLSNDQAAALQAAMWNVIGNFGYNPGGSSTLNKDVAALMKLVGAPGSNGSTVSGTPWSFLNGLAAYSTAGSYGSPNELLVIPAANTSGGENPLQYQVLVGYLPGTQAVAPEPSSMAIAGLGALGMIVYGWKRRKRS